MAHTTNNRRAGTKRQATPRGTSRRAKPSRSQTVWLMLVFSMTLVCGVLFMLDRKPSPGVEGRTLPPLMAIAGPESLETIFNTRAPLNRDKWLSIVIHDSGSPVGSPASLDAQARGMGLKGVGYHFVIGNGNGLGDGELHVTNRWIQQSNGAHASGPRADEFNRASVGICLIGNGSRQKFTRAQIDRLVQVVDALSKELGIPAGNVYLHSQIAPVNSPGALFPDSALRAQLAIRR
ncbi:MAG: N-acetylmuramoyl-L-alanine amidase [Phycisphaeraceae bacterium]|nr:N-acetylmuramoyl-L-alanine amidase [Phycisphaeraceae bacterium]MBX3409854.1 N-acetylmuramoyl-L-alanine amidase [Phycisphaeraceae bacterium]